jgi:23S rRNA (adenine2503-C2)-methyltransferase
MQQLNDSHPAMRCIGNYLPRELSQKLVEMGHPAYRGNQLFRAVYAQQPLPDGDIQQITVLPQILRQELAEYFGPAMRAVKLGEAQKSADGTVKMLFHLLDDTAVETVLIPSEMVDEQGDPRRRTLCISTQVGCALGCAFCATASLKLKRNLAVAEIVDQFMAAREICQTDITNIVFMGMGEPMLNYDNVMKAVQILCWGDNPLMSPRHITLSTAGVVPGIIRMADEKSPIKLAISLHATTNGQRRALMPIARKFELSTLLDAAEYYYRKTRRAITYEYILFQGFNDSEEDARRLAKITRRVPSKVNVIPFHEIEFTSPEGLAAELKPAPAHTFHAFIQSLKNKDVTVMVRSSSGLDIDAACGQLAFSNAAPTVQLTPDISLDEA